MFTDDDFERCEQDLPGALRSVAQTFRGPSPDLVQRCVGRGRQRQRTRTWRRSAVAALLVGASVGGWAAIGGGSGDAASAPATRADAGPAPQRDLLPYLKLAIPRAGTLTDGLTVLDPTAPRVLRTTATVSATYTDGRGSSELAVIVSRPAPGTQADRMSSAYCGGSAPGDHCTRSALPDGDTLTVRRSSKDPQGRQDEWSVVYTRTDSARVDVRVGGGVLAPGVNRTDPALSVEQLTKIARNPAWAPVIEAQPTPEEQVFGLLPRLLPPGARVVSRDETPTVAEFVVETTKGRSALNVTVSAVGARTAPSCPAGVGDDVCRRVTLSDGKPAIVTRNLVEEDRTVPLSVTAHTPEGLRIRLDAGMTAEAGAPSQPGLTADELTAIAASPLWASV